MIDFLILNQTLIYFFISTGLYFLIVCVPYLLFFDFKIIYSNQNLKTITKIPIEINIHNQEIKRAIKNTLISFIVIFITIYFLNIMTINNWQNYLINPIKEKNFFVHFLLVVALVLIHDAYFYWTHLLMHKNKYLYQFHLTHHESSVPTPLSALNFHLVETIIHFIFFPIIYLLLPVDMIHLLIFYIFMLMANSFGHLPIEFYPKNLYKWPITKTFNAATHHILHHQSENKNFGIYYMWWDKWMNTLHHSYYERYKIIHQRKK